MRAGQHKDAPVTTTGIQANAAAAATEGPPHQRTLNTSHNLLKPTWVLALCCPGRPWSQAAHCCRPQPHLQVPRVFRDVPSAAQTQMPATIQPQSRPAWRGYQPPKPPPRQHGAPQTQAWVSVQSPTQSFPMPLSLSRTSCLSGPAGLLLPSPPSPPRATWKCLLEDFKAMSPQGRGPSSTGHRDGEANPNCSWAFDSPHPPLHSPLPGSLLS